MSDKQGPVRRLTITGCEDVYHGVNKKGNDYTIYEIQATDKDGQVVQQTLKSFEQLDIGLTADFEVERYDGGDRGVSFTLKRQREKLGPRVQRLEEEIVPALDRRIEHLERSMGVQSTPPQEPPPPESIPAPIENPKTARFGSDDDVPFARPEYAPLFSERERHSNRAPRRTP